MARKQSAFFVAALGLFATLAFAAGCGGDDTSDNPGNGDAGPDVATDGFVPPGNDGGPPDSGPKPDGSPDGGPCDFNAFVTDLINNHTTATDLPSTDLGDKCVDTHTPFPDVLFQ